MSTVVSHPPGMDLSRIRQAILGSGLECALTDCVPWKELGVRLSRADAELLVVNVAHEPKLDWPSLGDALALTRAPLIVVGPEDEQCIKAARNARAVDYVREANVEREMPTVVERLMNSGSLRRERGSIVSVLAPAAGSGGSVVAANLAGALAELHPEHVALVELTRRSSDLALLMNVTPEHSITDVAATWRRLDRMSMKHYFVREELSGVNLLLNEMDKHPDAHFPTEAVHRMGLLSRLSFRFTLFALEGNLDAAEIEALRMSDKIVLVVRPDVPSVRRTQWTLQVLEEQGISLQKIQLVVNRWGSAGQLKLKQIQESLGMETNQLIPEDSRRVNQAVNHGVLLRTLAPRSKIYNRFRELASTFHVMGSGKNSSSS